MEMFFSLKIFIYLFLERGEVRESERERNMYMREKHRSAASHTHPDRGPDQFPVRHVP